jgi:predicted acyltransferase (DUF342 family)
MIRMNRLIVGAVASIGMLASVTLPAYAVPTTSRVYPGNMQGWVFFQENSGSSTGSMVSGPITPPIGVGSANLVLGTGSMVLGKAAYAGMRLDNITSLEYSTYRTSGPAAAAITLQFDIDSDVEDENTVYKGRLVYEPYHSETVLTGQWQTWNTRVTTGTGSWWFSRNLTNDLGEGCPQSDPCTWGEVLRKFPNIGVNSLYGVVLLKAGSGGGPADLNVDKLVINNDVYDFGPVPTIDLGVADQFSLLAGTAIVTGASNVLPHNVGAGAAITTGAANLISGNLYGGAAITTGAANEIKGSVDAGAALTVGASNAITGAQAFDVAIPKPVYSNAMAALDAAMADAISRPATLKATELGGITLETGIYSTPTYFTLTGTLTLDAKNDPNAVFIMRSSGYVSTAAGSLVVLENGAQASNVFWITGSYFTAGAGALLAGNVLAAGDVTLGAGARFTGHIFSQSGSITLGADVTIK